MRATVFGFGLLLALVCVPITPALTDSAAPADPASGALGAPGTAYCEAVARQCGTACTESTDPGSAAAASCQARCAIERAACDAQDGLSQVEPWFADKAEKMDRFMQGFHDNQGDRSIEAPDLHHDDEQDERAGPSDDSDPGASGDPTVSCAADHEACAARCEARHSSDSYAQAGCDSVCALDRATCEANAGVDAAKPFVEREAERLRQFFDGFLNEDEPAPPPPSWGEENPDGTLNL